MEEEKTAKSERKSFAFPFHYGQEAESYTFYRVPKILFTAEAFDHLSTQSDRRGVCCGES